MDITQISFLDDLISTIKVPEPVVSPPVVTKDKNSNDDLLPPKSIVDKLDSVKTVIDIETEFGAFFKHDFFMIYNDVFTDLDRERYDADKYKYEVAGYFYGSNRKRWNPQFIGERDFCHGSAAINILFVDDKCIPWTARIKIGCNQLSEHRHRVYIENKSSWKKATRFNHYVHLQDNNELEELLRVNKPYTYEFMKDVCGDPMTFVIAPELEILAKAEYVFAARYYNALKEDLPLDQDYLDYYNRLIDKTGKTGKIKYLFNTSKEVCRILKDNNSMEVWDRFRKLDKFGKVSKDDLAQVYNMNFNDSMLRLVTDILSKEYHNKKIFTFTSLTNYLNRVDMYEAITTDEALHLIKDYISMCLQMDKPPKIDGDSLKREHDVTARTHRTFMYEKRQAELKDNKEHSQEKYSYLRQYDYAEDIFLIRGIRNMNDLLDEANQQSNCVASYHDRICRRNSLIFVLRECSNPQKSVATIELSPDGNTIRQKFLAYNRPINNKSMSEFIERWHNHTKEVMKVKTEVYELPEELESQFYVYEKVDEPEISSSEDSIEEVYENEI